MKSSSENACFNLSNMFILDAGLLVTAGIVLLVIAGIVVTRSVVNFLLIIVLYWTTSYGINPNVSSWNTSATRFNMNAVMNVW